MNDIFRQFEQRDRELARLQRERKEVDREHAKMQAQIQVQSKAAGLAERDAETASVEAAQRNGLCKASQANLAMAKTKLASADADLTKLRAEHAAQLARVRRGKVIFRDEMIGLISKVTACIEEVLAKPEERHVE